MAMQMGGWLMVTVKKILQLNPFVSFLVGQGEKKGEKKGEKNRETSDALTHLG